MTRLHTRPYDLRTAQWLQHSGQHPALARIFAARGVRHTEELDTALQGLLAPHALLHAQKAARLLADLIAQDKKITFIADYDCDGATACAVGVRGLRMMGARVDYIVPNRFEYGYGLTPEIVALAVRTCQPDYLLTVDNGIASVEGVAAARALGVGVIITDHHLPGAQLPDADVIVNPNQPGCTFPSKHLAGVGVMFYVLLALRAELRARTAFAEGAQPRLDGLLDLVALGTVADVVSLDANNRRLVAQGLKRIREGRMQCGVAALFQVAGRHARQATPFDLGFALGPRLNAAGRLTDMRLGIECLLTDSTERALELAQALHEINQERKVIESDMQVVATQLLEQQLRPEQHTICIFDPDWHQGVIGIVASRLKERHHRPTLVFAATGDGLIKGSGRSIAGFHLRDALDMLSKRAPHLIQKFGGHAMAAGLTLREADFAAFSEAFESVARDLLTPAQLEHRLDTDGSLEHTYCTLDFISLLDTHVWGQGFPAPLFCDTFRLVSQRILKEKHLKLSLERNGQVFDAIWFNQTILPSPPLRVAYRLDANTYNGSTRVQLLVEHIETIQDRVD